MSSPNIYGYAVARKRVPTGICKGELTVSTPFISFNHPSKRPSHD